MRTKMARLAWLASAAAGLGLTWAFQGLAQDRTYPRLSGTETRAAVPVKHVEVSEARQLEIDAELAFLSDPITFPYILAANVTGPHMEVRGLVPNKTVKEHALKLARLRSPLTVVDAMREDPSLTVRGTRVSADKLHAGATLAIQQALPGGHKRVLLETTPDGKVTVKGSVGSSEEMLVVSQALRRVHGCNYVVNRTRVATDGPDVDWRAALPGKTSAAAPAKTAAPLKTGGIVPALFAAPGAKTPVAASKDEAAEKSKEPGFFARLFGKKKTTPPPPKTTEMPKATYTPKSTYMPLPPPTAHESIKISTPDAEPLPKGTLPAPLPKGPVTPAITTSDKKKPAATTPYEASGVILLPGPDAASAKKAGKPLSAPQLKTRLSQLFPGAGPIQIIPEGGNKIRVEISARTAEESNNLASRILSLPELEPYEVNLHIRMDAPK